MTILEDCGINKYYAIIALISNLHVYCNITQIPSYFCEKSKASFLVLKISTDLNFMIVPRLIFWSI